jgi:hypothetical protein
MDSCPVFLPAKWLHSMASQPCAHRRLGHTVRSESSLYCRYHCRYHCSFTICNGFALGPIILEHPNAWAVGFFDQRLAGSVTLNYASVVGCWVMGCQSIWDKKKRCYWEHVGNIGNKLRMWCKSIWNLMKTHWEQGKMKKNLPPSPTQKETSCVCCIHSW